MNICNNCSKRRDIRKECPWGGIYHHKGENGEHIGICNAYKQETKADHIQAMSDEELIRFQASLIKTLGCPPNNPEVCIDDCEKCWGIYLRQPWEGDA